MRGLLSFLAAAVALLVFSAGLLSIFAAPLLAVPAPGLEAKQARHTAPLYDFFLTEDADPAQLDRRAWRIEWQQLICVYDRSC